MIVLAHRGYWNYVAEKNSLQAFKKAFTAGFGIETDVRDYNGRLVISHDIATEESPAFEEVLKLYRSIGVNVPLALNVKADGIQALLQQNLQRFEIDNYFMFDMSIPEQVVYLKYGFHTFSRQSEYEQVVCMYDQTSGVWMDEFEKPWITDEIIKAHIRNGKCLGIISSEIHGNDTLRLWSLLKEYKESSQIMLCTDKPMEARRFFNEKD